MTIKNKKNIIVTECEYLFYFTMDELKEWDTIGRE